MILLCDEMVGTGVPKALYLVEFKVHSLIELKWGGQPDIEWLARAGEKEWMVFSCNKKMLLVPSERETIIQKKVGIVFLTNGEEHPAQVLRLLLNRWDVLNLLWETTERPFARFLSPKGHLTSKYKHYKLESN